MQGRCQCGAITFDTPTPTPTRIYICHCTECRHQSSSAFGITTIFPRFDVPMPLVALLSFYTRATDSGGTMDCLFCRTCGSRIMHRRPGKVTVSVKGGCLDGLTKEMLDGAVHIWTKRAIVPIPEGAKSFPGEPDDD